MIIALLLAVAQPSPPAPPAAKPAEKAAEKPTEKAADKAPAPNNAPPPPAPELDQLKVFDGKWACTGKTLETPYGTAHALTATMENKLDLNGYWRLWRYVEKKTKENPQPYVMVSFVGFDALKKQLVRTDVDGIGMMTNLSTRGWDGDKLVWDGLVGPAKVPFRETLTKTSDKEIAGTQEITGVDGKWIALSETVCKKSK